MTAITMLHTATRRDAVPRRGMLLLLVLSILALFLVVGAIGILLALRAREAAQAFAAASAGTAASTALARTQLDEALLKLIRGPSQPAAQGKPIADVTESLLEDKYGTALSGTGTVTAISGTNAAFLTVTLTGAFTDTVTGSSTTVAALLANPASVAGRVLTFVPRPEDPTGPTSYRILRTSTTASTVQLANVKPNTPLPLPARFPCDAVINGREFTGEAKNEAYDAFDDQNPFLTRPTLQGSRIDSIARPAFGAAGDKCVVDNDGDGVADGVWLDDVLPPRPTPDGGALSFRVSYLVLDLDGRLNVNAHGSFVRAQTPQTSPAQYPNDPRNQPLGLGYGPADVDAALLVATQAEATSGGVPARYVTLLQGGTVTTNATVSTGTQWRPRPPAEATQAGRYGLGTAVQPGGTVITGTSPLNADYWLLNPAGNSPTDLKARLQVFTTGSPPVLRFARPASGPAWVVAGTDTDDVLGSGTAAHPYRMRLDEDAPRGAGTVAVDAIYTLGELERILRQFDADASLLDPRLAAILDELAERSRMTLTTDSWDTPAITGEAARRILATGTGAGVYAVYSPETVANLRFNLNRPLVSGSARQDYFRQLYSLIRVLTGTSASPTPAAAAQWAANVVEFRDPDSIMGWYPYDDNPLDGVWTTGTGVWGMERPELVLTEATVDGSKVTAKLYRPWAAECVRSGSAVSTEWIDASLGVSGTANTLDATKAIAGTSGSTAVWRVSVGGTASGLNTLMPSATAVRVNTPAGTVTLTASSPPTEVVLQRLADPRKELGAALDTGSGTNAYVDVHRVSIPLQARDVNRWLHWPNRDLVSHGELLTVPSGDPAVAPEVCFEESKETSLARTHPIILDATIVPSRFAGAHVSVASGTFLANTGLENFQYGQFSRWREPGRVNVNTILTNTSNTPATLDNAVWNALVGRSGLTNPATPAQPIKTDRELLVSGNEAVFPRTGTADAASAFLKRSTAIRLANCGTIRSHVFAVWITIEITDSSPNGGLPRIHRMFAIVDRSIPVASQPGRTLNVRESIRLQRFLE